MKVTLVCRVEPLWTLINGTVADSIDSASKTVPKKNEEGKILEEKENVNDLKGNDLEKKEDLAEERIEAKKEEGQKKKKVTNSKIENPSLENIKRD